MRYKSKYKLYKYFHIKQKPILQKDFKICQKKQFIFIHVPKTAGKSIRYLLFGRSDGAIHSSAYSLRRFYKNEWDLFFKFCFVRNPYGRLISAYNYLSKGGNQSPKDIYIRDMILPKTNFEDFVLSWLNKDKIYSFSHLVPQHEFIYFNKHCLVDFIGRYERIDDDFLFVANKLNIEKTLPHLNKSSDTSKYNNKDLNKFYTNKMKKKVEQLYYFDFLYFDY